LDTTRNTWRRFSAAFSKTANHRFIACAVLVAALCAQPSYAQETKEEDKDPLANLDPLTRAVERNPLTLIRIAALGLKDPAEQGEALAGLVAAFLARNKPDDAAIELKAIEDKLWLARALLHVSDDQHRRGRLQTSKATLARALKLASGKQIERDGGETVKRVTERYLALKTYQDATNTALLIPDRFERVGALLRIAKTLQDANVRALTQDAQKVLAATFGIAKSIKPDTKDSINTLIRIAEFQVSSGDRKGSRKTLAYAEEILKKTTFDGRDALRAELAAALVLLNDRVAAQAIVRSMADAARKSKTIASIARASAQSGDLEAAVSLFTLAFQEAATITDKGEKYDALAHLIAEQSKVGRLADAFKNAGVIRDRRRQSEALLGMGKVLLKQKKMKEAIKLVDYIPYVGMRTQIFTPVALFHGRKGDRAKASALLARALEPTKFKAAPRELAKALPMVIDVQARVGVASMNEALFRRVENQLDQLPDDPAKIQVLTGIASADARVDRRDAALRSLAAAWRISWLNRKNPKYPEILTNLMRAQIEVGELLQAFDTAARVPESPTPDKPKGQLEASLNARNQALQRVAVAAARQGKQRLSLRAARRIRNSAARARVYSAIAQAFPTGQITKVAPKPEPKPEPALPAKTPASPKKAIVKDKGKKPEKTENTAKSDAKTKAKEEASKKPDTQKPATPDAPAKPATSDAPKSLLPQKIEGAR